MDLRGRPGCKKSDALSVRCLTDPLLCADYHPCRFSNPRRGGKRAPFSGRRPHTVITRRIAFTGIVVAAVFAAWVLVWRPEATPRDPQANEKGAPRPNVLIIVTDDQRADHTLQVMPEVRRWFADGGVRFSQAFSTTPLCCPSRASIFTGQYAHNHNVINNQAAARLDQGTTIQHYLKEQGYTTGLFGKYLNSWDMSRTPPEFDRWAVQDGGYYDAQFNVQGQLEVIPGSSTDFVEDRTLDFLRLAEVDDERPWFAYVGVRAPHWDFEPSPRYVGAPVPPWKQNPAHRETDKTDKPRYVQHADDTLGYANEVRKKQLRTLMSVDDLVGDVFESLGRLGESPRTLAVFMSDNGYFWGEHGLMDKRLPYLQSSRIPMLLRWPGHVAPGTVDSRLVANIDVAPTVFDAVGIEPDHVMDGRSLLGSSQRRSLLLEYMKDPGWAVPTWAALHSDKSQYVEYYARKRVSFREFYDLSRDKWQLENLLQGRASAVPVARLHNQLQRLRACFGTDGAHACP
jgi:arylsulfatase A-like enzyme